MKRVIFVLFFCFAFFAGLSAQGRFTVQDRVKMLQERLSLTDSQTAKVDSILTAATEKMKNIEAAGPDRRMAMHEIFSSADKEIEKILNDDQLAEFKKMQSQRRGRMGRRQAPNN